jgi:hypothetical protein
MPTEPMRSHSPLRLRKRTLIDIIAIGFAFAIVLATVSGVVDQKKFVAHANPAPILVSHTTTN